MRILVTGGAGFVGSTLSIELATRHSDWRLVAADNLYRRGSELNLGRLAEAGVEFTHLDVGDAAAVDRLGEFDAIVEGAAEPAVGASGDAAGRDRLMRTNLLGLYNCLELAARAGSHFIALSTSRVYPVGALHSLALEESETRFELAEAQPLPGASRAGIAESFPLNGARTLYGSSKLTGELLAAEYAADYDLPVTVNRCGVISGPWQMGRSDQGVFAHWMMSFYFSESISYIGYGGTGKQVRDVLHVDDLIDLLELQLREPEHWRDAVFNVGGGAERSLSLLEASDLCRELTGNDLELGSVPETRPGDVPIYVSDCTALYEHSAWRPRRSSRELMEDLCAWVGEHEAELRRI